MKKLVMGLVLLAVGVVYAQLPIPKTKFNKESLERVESAAGEGNPEAQFELALRYYAGYQVVKNETTSFEWMSQSAGQKHPGALVLLSQMYAEGIGVSADLEKADRWFAAALAVNPGDPRLKERFDRLVENRKNASGNADSFLKKCAEAGYLPAYISMHYPAAVRFYENGQYAEALSLFTDLSNRGDSVSTCYLALMHAKGLGTLPQDDVEAFVLYQQAATNGNAQAQFELAKLYEAGTGIAPDPEQARFWYQKAAENGQADAQVRLAELEFSAAIIAEEVLLSPDADGPQFSREYNQRVKSALSWYKTAAEQGHPEALYMMGRMCASGDGTFQDFKQAVKYYEAAVARGHKEALFYLGLMHHAGLGTEQTLSEAISLYQKAAAEGVTGALYYLGNAYRSGAGVPKNLIKGEGIYYGKILKGRRSDLCNGTTPSSSDSDRWVHQAAREYAVISWNKASTREKAVDAVFWAGIAAKHGDASAAEILLQMNTTIVERDRNGVPRLRLSEKPVTPRQDAVLRKRAPDAFPYVMREMNQVYKKSVAQKMPILATVKKGTGKNIAGEDLVELSVKYKTPPKQMAADYRGILLMAVEFFDKAAGKKRFAFAEYRLRPVGHAIDAYYDASMFIDAASYPDATITGWAVVYGHLLPDGVTVAVLGSAGNTQKPDALVELCARNRYAEKLDVKVVSALDLQMSPSDEGGVVDEQGVLDTILDYIPGL